MKFKTYIERCDEVTLENIRDAAVQALPQQYRRRPWVLTDQGGSNDDSTIYTEELQLDAYLASYTDWHKGKLEKAFELLDDTLPPKINIIDWGCGQGLATIFMLDFIRENKIQCFIDEVILIEPSKVALKRAEYLINRADSDISLRTINKTIDDVSANDILFESQHHVFQLFSNILDIKGINLKHLSQIVYTNNTSHNTLICVSPFYYEGNCRLRRFFNYFKQPLTFDESREQSDKDACGYTYNIRVAKLEANDQGQIVNYEFYPAVQFRAMYELSALLNQCETDEYLTYFDVFAPFDLGISISDDINPILAVINNIITRGLPTIPTIFVERNILKYDNNFQEYHNGGCINFKYDHKETEESDSAYKAIIDALKARKELKFSDNDFYNELAYTPLAISRIQKLLIEVLISGRLKIDTREWNILIEEKDIPCAALALEDFRQIFDTLTSMSVEYESVKLPKINLTIICNNRYLNSPLHLGQYHTDKITDEIRNTEYDLVIHYSTNVKTQEYDFTTFKTRRGCYFAIFSSDNENLTAERFIYTTDRITYHPFVSKDIQGDFVEDEKLVKQLTFFLNFLFRKEKFRNGQLPILSRAMSNLSVIGLLPTGSGKSLTYQLAAMLQPGITIVIDPLISLMKDQYDGLLNASIDSCTFINSTVDDKARREEMMEHSKIQFVFLSPERLAILRFRSRLRNMQDLHVYFAYGVIDEVHCVSEWGHDFRFAYLHLGRNLYNYVLPKQTKTRQQHLTLFGLTATASFDVLADVERELSGNGAFPIDSDAIVRYENTNRLELQYHVIKVDGSRCANKWDVFRKKSDMLPGIVENSILELDELQKPENIARIKQRFIQRESITNKAILQAIESSNLKVDVANYWYSEIPNKASSIVFCPHRQGSLGVNDTDRNIGIATSLKNNLAGAKISTYVGGDALTEQERFISGETSIMVATKAFGMGIDKPNVRFTYNVNFSGSLEAFVQEAGRAGRDRKMALATILYCPKIFTEVNPRTHLPERVPVDYGIHKFFYDNNFIGEEFEKRVMLYLMTESCIDITNEDFSEIKESESGYRRVSGFMKELLAAEEGSKLISYISYDKQVNGDTLNGINRWLVSHQYPVLTFCEDRSPKQGEVDFVATIEKAIYRMCCVGIIDDYTKNYSDKLFRIVTTRKSDEEYFNHLKVFLMRYYTEERADIEMKNAYDYKGQNSMQKCLGYITEFVYNKIAQKRERAIKDIETFCDQAIPPGPDTDWLETNEDLKDFIYFYFNSKFAREDYVAENGKQYSLTTDTEHGKKSSYEILFKYMNVVDDDIVGVSGSPKDNIKHLQGAIRLIRRSLTDENPALDLLNVFCLLYLNTSHNKNQEQELHDSFFNGYKEFKKRTENYEDFYEKIESYYDVMQSKKILTRKKRAQLREWQQICEVELLNEWLSDFKGIYLKDWQLHLTDKK